VYTIIGVKIKIMRKRNLVILVMALTVVIVNCAAPKKVVTTPTPTVKEAASPIPPIKAGLSFAKDILPTLKISCAPCHFPPSGTKEPLDTYTAVKEHIGEVLERIKLPKDATGFMPFQSKKPVLSDSTIKVLEQWQKDGMAE
jgi:hypothetical protein